MSHVSTHVPLGIGWLSKCETKEDVLALIQSINEVPSCDPGRAAARQALFEAAIARARKLGASESEIDVACDV
jgi:hypothetical protein